MIMNIEVKKYDAKKGLQLCWEQNYVIEVKKDEDEVVIIANSDGLISLATHMLTLAQEEVPLGTHIHYDKYNSLENESVDLIIEKRN